MRPTKPLLLSAAVVFCACISLPDIEEPPPPPPPQPPSVTVALAAPSGITYTNGAVSVQLQLQGDTPEQVELLVDDQPLTTLQAPYTFTWNTASVTEGQHRLSARARIADKTFSSEAREVIVDRTPPQVVSRTPTPGAENVWVRQPIQATFSEPLKPGTVTSDSVKLAVGGAEATASLSLSTDGKTLTVVPNPVLRASTNPQITMTSGVSDLAGNALSLPSDTWSWNLPLTLSEDSLSAVPGSTDATHPFLEPDSDGKMFVVWREPVSGNQFNVYAYRETNNEWEPLGGALNDVPYTSPINPGHSFKYMLRLDSSKNPVVSWIQSDGGTPGINFKRWLNGAWVSLAYPLYIGGHIPTSLALQLNTADGPVIAWEQADDSSRQFIHVWKWANQRWDTVGAPLPSGTTGAGSLPVLVLDGSNNPTVAWVNRTSSSLTHGITVQHWNGSTWEALGGPILAHSQPLDWITQPRLILDSSGSPILAWTEREGGVFDVHVRRWTGTSWEPLGGTLSAFPGNTSADSPDLAMDPLGNIFIAWLEPDGNGSVFIHMRRWAGSSWETLGPPVAQRSLSPLSLRIGPSGIPYVACSLGDSANGIPATIRIHRYNY